MDNPDIVKIKGIVDNPDIEINPDIVDNQTLVYSPDIVDIVESVDNQPRIHLPAYLLSHEATTTYPRK